MNLTELRYDLDVWASWKASGAVMPSGTLGRILDSAGGSVPGSRPPAGVEIPRRLAALMEAMEDLPDSQDIGPSLFVVRSIYLRGRGASIEQVAEYLSLSMTRLKEHRRIGEGALLGWMMAKGF